MPVYWDGLRQTSLTATRQLPEPASRIRESTLLFDMYNHASK